MPSVEEATRAAILANRGLSLGPLLLAMAFDSLTMGIIANQFFRYVTANKKEALHTRAIVYIATAASAVTTYYVWAWEVDLFAYHYGSYAQFASQKWSAWLAFLCPFTKISVQIFYAERAWRINGCRNLILVSIGICLMLSALGSISFTFFTYKNTDKEISFAANAMYYLWPTACISADLITTGSILWGLSRSRTGWSGTDKLITKLVRTSVEAQVPPTIFAALVLMNWSQKGSSVGIIFISIYLTGCLSILNSRDSLRQDGSTYGYSSNSNFNSTHRSSRLHQDTVLISTDTYVEHSPSTALPKTGLNRELASGKDSVDDLEAGLGGLGPLGGVGVMPGMQSVPSLEVVYYEEAKEAGSGEV
ncbi:hypothetical protein IAT38_003951 [Cryptococcus sp. DSM 104549]